MRAKLGVVLAKIVRENDGFRPLHAALNGVKYNHSKPFESYRSRKRKRRTGAGKAPGGL
jgi:hypothetical protein